MKEERSNPSTGSGQVNLAAQNRKLLLEGSISYWNHTMKLAEQRIKNEGELVDICKVQIYKAERELKLMEDVKCEMEDGNEINT